MRCKVQASGDGETGHHVASHGPRCICLRICIITLVAAKHMASGLSGY